MIKSRRLRLFLGLLALVVLTAIGLVVLEKVRGGKRLERARAAYLADGGSFDPSFRFATPIPDAENFAASPALRGITKGDPGGDALRKELEKLGLKHATIPPPRDEPKRKDGHEVRARQELMPLHDYLVKSALLPVPATPTNLAAELFQAFETAHGAKIAELHATSSRPQSQFLPLATDVIAPGTFAFAEAHPELRTSLEIARGLTLHAILALRSDSADTALADLRTVHQLAVAARADAKSLIGFLTSLAITATSIQPIWEGVADRRWTDGQLQELQSILARRDLRGELTDAIAAELIATDELLGNLAEYLSAYSPGTPVARTHIVYSPWVAHNQAQLIELYHKGTIAPLRQTDGYSKAIAESAKRLTAITDSSSFDPRTLVAKLVVIAVKPCVEKTARIDAELAQAAAACALERYFLANQAYPDKLDALVPEFAPAVPLDPADGDPLRYQLTPDGRYQLHSIGVDGIDQRGAAGDITWNFAAP